MRARAGPRARIANIPIVRIAEKRACPVAPPTPNGFTVLVSSILPGRSALPAMKTARPSPANHMAGRQRGLGRRPSGNRSGTKGMTNAIPAIQIQLPSQSLYRVHGVETSATAGSTKHIPPAINSQPIGLSGRLAATSAPTVAHAPANVRNPTVTTTPATLPEPSPIRGATHATRMPIIENAQVVQASRRAVWAVMSSPLMRQPGVVPSGSCRSPVRSGRRACRRAPRAGPRSPASQCRTRSTSGRTQLRRR